MKTYVIDQNMMRKPMLVALIAGEPNSSFIVPDVALLEMSKGQNWEGTMRPSLAALEKANNRTHFSLSIGEALDRELHMLRPITAQDLINSDMTSFGRSLIKELASATPATSMATIQAKFSQVFTRLQTSDLDAATAKSRMVKLAQLFKKGLKQAVIKALRSHMYPQYRLALIAAQAEQFLYDHILPEGIAPAVAEEFLSHQPITYRYSVLLTRHALDWAIEGGLDALPATRELNHLFDIEYVLTASYFDDLLTEDSGARSAYDDLKQIMGMPPNIITGVLESSLQSILVGKK